MTTAPGDATPRGNDRRHQSPGRQHRINLRLNPDEHRDVLTAAIRARLTPSGFCADAALAAARGIPYPAHPITGVDITWAELAAFQRDLFAARTDLGTLAPPDHVELTLRRIDSVIDRIDQRLR